MFEAIEEKSLSRDWVYSVTVNVLEIYNETIRDLLSTDQNQKLEIKLGADGLNHVRGLTDFQVGNIDHVNEVLCHIVIIKKLVYLYSQDNLLYNLDCVLIVSCGVKILVFY